jgi:hypothetical protein
MKKNAIFIVCILACTSVFSQQDVDIFPGDFELSQVVLTALNPTTGELVSKNNYTPAQAMVVDGCPYRNELIWSKVWVAFGSEGSMAVTELILYFNRHKYILDGGIYLYSKWVENDEFAGFQIINYNLVNQGNSITITFDPAIGVTKDITGNYQYVDWIIELIMVKP